MKEVFKLLLELIKELQIVFIDKLTRLTKVRKFKALPNIKLNLGCGIKSKVGFVNIDLCKSADLRLDLRKNLPFKDNSINYIYSEHFLEHISYTDATVINCLKDYYRILQNGAKMKHVIPDMEKVFNAYSNKNINHFSKIIIEEKIPQSKEFASLIDYVNYGVYQFGQHKYCYDFEKFDLLLRSIGFKNIENREFNPKEDSIERKDFSFYIEAFK